MYKHEIYEAKLPFILRFMVDNAIVGCNWLQVTAGNYLCVEDTSKVWTSK